MISTRYLSSGSVAIICYLAIPIAYFQDMAFFGKQAEEVEISGMALILVVNVTIGILKMKKILT
jgi:hypothetical protein